jgi:4'-phosphopantetheinyl transferase
VIDVLYTLADVRDEELARLEALLTSVERERATRYKFGRDQRRAIVSRGRLRELLARYTDDVDIVEDGKPALRNQAIEFNVSHSGDFIAYAFATTTPVGIDIEQIRPMGDDRERIMAEAISDEDFFARWTAKEAVLKASGAGLGGTADENWIVRAIEAPAGYCAAVAHRPPTRNIIVAVDAIRERSK